MASGGLARWLYRGGRPNRLAKVVNGVWAKLFSFGVARDYLVTLEVRGRRSGRTMTLPMVMAVVDGQRYLVSMLGERVDWVRNVRAAGGHAVLIHGRREAVRLEDVPVPLRAPILKAYLRRAPGARAHHLVDLGADRVFGDAQIVFCLEERVSAGSTGSEKPLDECSPEAIEFVRVVLTQPERACQCLRRKPLEHPCEGQCGEAPVLLRRIAQRAIEVRSTLYKGFHVLQVTQFTAAQ